jgi:RimJ/RimL family protein N-acetyltransferase
VNWLQPVTLSGEAVTLESLGPQHCANLQDAVRDGELWSLWYTTIPRPEDMSAEIERRLSLQRSGSMLPFAAVERSTGMAVGMTTYMNVDAANRRLEIGSTWYRKRVQRTALNTESKILLLTHAFETLGSIAVEFRTSSFNFQSRRAIERLGAHLDGVLRSHMRHQNGTVRDTYVYSIIASEWPAVKMHLTAALERSG